MVIWENDFGFRDWETAFVRVQNVKFQGGDCGSTLQPRMQSWQVKVLLGIPDPRTVMSFLVVTIASWVVCRDPTNSYGFQWKNSMDFAEYIGPQSYLDLAIHASSRIARG